MTKVPARPRTRKPASRAIWLDPIPADTSRTHVRLTVGNVVVDYWLEKIPSDFGTAYRLEKFLAGGGDPEENTYHVHFTPDGSRTCECRGYLRHSHCKHADGLQALREHGRI